MTRISTRAANTILLKQNMQTQKRLFDAQIAITSEKKTNVYKGIANDSRRLVNLENSTSLMQRFNQNNVLMDVKLQTMNTSVEAIGEVFSNFKVFLADFEATSKKAKVDVQDIQNQALQALKSIEGYLNVSVDGQYLLSGKKVHSEPIDFGLTTLESFQTKYDGDIVSVATTRDAMLEDFSYNQDILNKNVFGVDATNFLQFNADSSTITASSPLLVNLTVGSTVTIANSASNNGNYQITAVSADGKTATVKTRMLTDETATAPTITYLDPDDVNSTISLTTTDFTELVFTKSNNTVASGIGNGLLGIPVGAAFTVTGSGSNNGNYTVVSNDGTNLVIDTLKLTNEGLTGNTFFDLYTNTDTEFTAATKTIEIRQSGTTTPVPNSFNGIRVGQSITVSTTASNNTAFTVATISTDGSSITVAETVTDETDTTKATFISTNNSNFLLKSGSQLVFDSTAKTIQLQGSSGASIDNAFSSLSVGMKITASSMPTSGNNATYTISAISSDGSTITVEESITATETDTNGARLSVYGAAGSISANSYYKGDNQSTTHRVSTTQKFSRDIDGIDPAFEKGIRGLQIIAQGVYGTAGGLDQNHTRVDDALYLIKSTLQRSVSGNSPYGDELTGNIEQVEADIGYNRVMMQTSNQVNLKMIAFFDSTVAGIENADLQSIVTRLLDDQVALDASYAAYARISKLSLTTYMK